MTIVVDTSAIVAILFDEPERKRFRQILEASPAVMSAGNVIELSQVIMRREPHRFGRERALLHALDIKVAGVDDAQVSLALEGQARFGRGRARSPAVLNLGDLFAYALARQLDAPLLFKGNDFHRTDVRPAL